MTRNLLAFVATALTFIALDFIWLTVASPTIYQQEIGPLLLEQPRIVPAVVFYFVYLIGVVVFVVRPAVEKGELRAATLPGALFGVVAYATYDLTTAATLRMWSWRVTCADMAWGTLVTAVAAAVGCAVLIRLKS